MEVYDQLKKIEKCQSPLRWIILILACLMMVGSYYCFDIPAALKTQIDDYMGDPSDYEVKFGLLYTLYAAPNVILPFFGGYLVDLIGVRSCLLLFSSLIAIGQVVFSFGLSIKSWPIIFIGRLIFGFGGESFTVANSALLAEWFKGKELALAFGINLSISKLGSVINNVVSPALASSTGIIFALWFGSILCAACVMCVIITIPIDKGFDLVSNKKDVNYSILANEDQSQEYEQSVSWSDGTKPLRTADFDVKERKEIRDSISSTNSSNATFHTVGVDGLPVVPILQIRQAGQSLDANSAVNRLSRDEISSNQENTQASLRDVFSLSYIFWVLVLLCAVVYGCVLPFNNISSSLLLERDYFKLPSSNCHLSNELFCESPENQPVNCPKNKWYQPPLPTNISVSEIDCSNSEWSNGCTSEYCSRLKHAESQASFIMSIPYIISAVLSPPMGIFIDRYGFRAIVATIAPGLLIIVHLLLGFSTVNPIGPLVGQGLAYTGFVSVLWPAIPLVVETRVTGLAFGIVTSMQNLACAVLPLVVALIYDESGDKYIPNVELLFVCLGFIGMCVGFYLNYYDFHHNSVLNRGLEVDPSKDSDADNNEANKGKNDNDDFLIRTITFDPNRKSFENGRDSLLGHTNNPLLSPMLSGDSKSNSPTRAPSSPKQFHYDKGSLIVVDQLGDKNNVPILNFGANDDTDEETMHGRDRNKSRSVSKENHKRGGSFTSYEEIMRVGGYRT
eukprot:gene13919-18666_t